MLGRRGPPAAAGLERGQRQRRGAREEEEDPDRWGRPIGVRGEGEGRSGPRETAGPAELGREKEGWAGGRGKWASGKEERKKEKGWAG